MFSQKCPILCLGCHVVWFVLLRGSLLLRDVTGKLSLAIGGLCSVLEHGRCCCWFCSVTALRSLGFFWMVSPADGEARDPRPASGLSASSKLKREDENEGRESIFRSVSTFKPLGLTPPTEASSNQMVLVGRSSAHVHGAYHFYTFM